MRLLTLQLGAGDVVEMDYDLRVDIRENLPGVNKVCDVRKLEGLEDGGAALIKASHLIEHFTREEQVNVLREWGHVLAFSGILLLWTPDRDWFEQSRATGVIDQDEYEITLGINGRRRYESIYSQHYFVWNLTDATVVLGEAGFRVIYSEVENGGSLFITAVRE